MLASHKSAGPVSLVAREIELREAKSAYEKELQYHHSIGQAETAFAARIGVALVDLKAVRHEIEMACRARTQGRQMAIEEWLKDLGIGEGFSESQELMF